MRFFWAWQGPVANLQTYGVFLRVSIMYFVVGVHSHGYAAAERGLDSRECVCENGCSSVEVGLFLGYETVIQTICAYRRTF